MADQEIYQEFIEWLGETWWRLTDSEARLPMIASYLTPEEAAFLSGFPRNMLDAGKTLDELAEAKQMDRDELEGIYERLDAIETREVKTVSHRPRRDLYYWPLALGLIVSAMFDMPAGAVIVLTLACLGMLVPLKLKVAALAGC